MTTGLQLHNRLPISSSVATQADTVTALNYAIDQSWPSFKLAEKATTAATLVSTTFAYTLATTIPYLLGGVRVWVNYSTTNPPRPLRDLRFSYDQSAGAWTITFSPAITSAYVGKTIDVEYQYPHPQISTISDTVYLPPSYAISAVTVWYAMRKLSEEHTDQRSFWERLLALHEPKAADALAANFIPPWPMLMTEWKDTMTV